MRNAMKFVVMGALTLVACGPMADSESQEPQAPETLESTEQRIGTCTSISCRPTTPCDKWCGTDEFGGDMTCEDYGVCTYDRDGDGLNDDVDNCKFIANANQADCDGDGIGTACDSDNAIWQPIGSNVCDTDKDWHAGYYSIELTGQQVFQDVSSCGQPNKSEKFQVYEIECAGWVSDSDCCADGWGHSTAGPHLLPINQQVRSCDWVSYCS